LAISDKSESNERRIELFESAHKHFSDLVKILQRKGKLGKDKKDVEATEKHKMKLLIEVTVMMAELLCDRSVVEAETITHNMQQQQHNTHNTDSEKEKEGKKKGRDKKETNTKDNKDNNTNNTNNNEAHREEDFQLSLKVAPFWRGAKTTLGGALRRWPMILGPEYLKDVLHVLRHHAHHSESPSARTGNIYLTP